MRFIDEAKIRIEGGHGGPGCVSFRRETFEPRGGPDGGDGGAGANVILKASIELGTLQDFRYAREYKAPAGIHGSGTNKAGRDGEDIVLRVPVGTLVKDQETGEVLVDFTTDGQTWVAARGGRGGKGNAHFVSSTFQAPRFAQDGEPGTSVNVTLELKLLADAAIIGFPNAGKSTLISRMSAARPKVADYAFTTLTPNLGVVTPVQYKSFVIADIPGLIEGAHRGMGLGHKFLKHIERTRVVVHLLDGSQLLEDATRPDIENSFEAAIDTMVERYQAIRKELELFEPALLQKPEIVALNKLDLIEADPELVERSRQALIRRIQAIRPLPLVGDEPYVLSAVSGNGLKELTTAIWQAIQLDKARETGRTEAPVLFPDDPAIRREQK